MDVYLAVVFAALAVRTLGEVIYRAVFDHSRANSARSEDSATRRLTRLRVTVELASWFPLIVAGAVISELDPHNPMITTAAAAGSGALLIAGGLLRRETREGGG
jgi:hypothetical protein